MFGRSAAEPAGAGADARRASRRRRWSWCGRRSPTAGADGLSATECSERTGLARVSARRYLEQLVAAAGGRRPAAVRHRRAGRSAGSRCGAARPADAADARTETTVSAAMLTSSGRVGDAAPMTIVVGYVPTPEGEAALTAAITEARLPRGAAARRQQLARRLPGRQPRSPPRTRSTTVRARLDEAGVVYEIDQLVRGHEASEELVEAADRVKASLIVIGLRRRTPTGKLITGSQAQRILLDANCPVLAVKAPH